MDVFDRFLIFWKILDATDASFNRIRGVDESGESNVTFAMSDQSNLGRTVMQTGEPHILSSSVWRNLILRLFFIIITESRPVRDPSYVIHQRSHYSSPNSPSHHLCRRTLILSKSVCNIMLHQCARTPFRRHQDTGTTTTIE